MVNKTLTNYDHRVRHHADPGFRFAASGLRLLSAQRTAGRFDSSIARRSSVQMLPPVTMPST